MTVSSGSDSWNSVAVCLFFNGHHGIVSKDSKYVRELFTWSKPVLFFLFCFILL